MRWNFRRGILKRTLGNFKNPSISTFCNCFNERTWKRCLDRCLGKRKYSSLHAICSICCQHMICHINATFSMFINKNIKGEMISPGNYNPPFEWKDGSGPGFMVRPVVTSFIWPIWYGPYRMVHIKWFIWHDPVTPMIGVLSVWPWQRSSFDLLGSKRTKSHSACWKVCSNSLEWS